MSNSNTSTPPSGSSGSGGDNNNGGKKKETPAGGETPTTSSALDEGDIAVLKTYSIGPYSVAIKRMEKEIVGHVKEVDELCGIRESDTGLAKSSLWDLVSDKEMMSHEHPLQVARCTKIIAAVPPSGSSGFIYIYFLLCCCLFKKFTFSFFFLL
jgi:hypothetical protein